jgi:hypothetical protein
VTFDYDDVTLRTNVGEIDVVIERADGAMTLSADELRWLVLVAGPAAMHAVEGAIPKVENRANRSCPR